MQSVREILSRRYPDADLDQGIDCDRSGMIVERERAIDFIRDGQIDERELGLFATLHQNMGDHDEVTLSGWI